MTGELVVRNTMRFNARAAKVWEALTNPALTKKYMYGCEVVSDWKVGSPILWKGVIEGQEMIFVKGTIVKIVPGKLLQYTTFDPNAGYEDMPSNYLTLTQELSEENGQTVLSITQGDFAKVVNGEKRYHDTVAGWEFTSKGLREVVEQPS